MVKRIFTIGEEWIYYKIYCGKKVADIILIESILPFAEIKLQSKIISKWFFIRYNDPDFHIRLRFYITEPNNYADIIYELKELFTPYLKSGFIWDLQIHQYQREIERYGNLTIPHIETIFSKDSTVILKGKQRGLSEEYGIVFLIKLIETILHQVKFSLDEKYIFVEAGMKAFRREFNANKFMIKKLGKKNRSIFDSIEKFNSPELIQLIESYESGTNNAFTNINLILQSNSVDVSLNSLTTSIIHMSINRYFNTNQRLYELLIYNVLHSFYKTQLYKSKLL